MDTTPHPPDDPTSGPAPPMESTDDVEALADLDAADAADAAEDLARRLAAELDAESASPGSTGEPQEPT